ncbi:hypothetical protein BDR07DRAFT_1312569, partial [Suillus spraguei]
KKNSYDPTNPKMNPLNLQADLGYFHVNRCCACPEMKSACDACFLQNGGKEGKCAELLQKHVECM